MASITKPEGLPDCQIINALITKANAKGNFEFNYIHYLEELRKIVSIEVSQINLLFPEYTPHDEKYHLKRLFFVADELLGPELIDAMNTTELFLLSSSLYGHDWGMAVSEAEKEYIVNGKKDDKAAYNLLDDEHKKFIEFCKRKNVSPKEIAHSDWQDYVRLTHAARSGKRIKSFFEKINQGIGEFASRICEGHYLDFDVIEDHTSYPTDCSLNLDIVNVKAITVYVRLIDLLDIGEDRTPYILWKFVSPRNKFSKLEWSKHRAIQPVTFPKYQAGRYIQVDAGTEDINVYMSIMDLKRYVDEQFRGCSNILNRINHPYHVLNISHIDWRVAAKGFKPIQVQFEFDRTRMFEILSDEIYQSDPYVFIRELVQNAIDAIRMRIELVQKKEMTFNGKITVEISDLADHYEISIKDNGIGMDEYIIRNYLSVAGKSYYRSVDFQKEGLKMEPISRFGIGVLSCFMVADYMEIITHRDPYFSSNSEKLKITIPSRENHFIIEPLLEQVDVGSAFKVFISKDKLPKNKKTKAPIIFHVTEYLRYVAAFIEFPILVKENSSEIIINSPATNRDSKPITDYHFPFEKAILPQNIETAREFFEEKQINLKTDLGLKDYDGCITYLLPKKETLDIVNTGFSWPTREIKVVDYTEEFEKENRIQWNDHWVQFRRSSRDEETDIPILKRKSCFSIYLDGILIHDIESPEINISETKENGELDRYDSLRDSFLCPQLLANIPKPKGLKLDLARTKISSDKKWDFHIWAALFAYLKKEYKNRLENANLSKRLLSLGQFSTFFALPDGFIIDLVTPEEFPVPFYSHSGSINYKLFKELGNKIYLPPKYSENKFYHVVKDSIFSKETKNTIIKNWNGGDFILLVDKDESEKQPASIVNMLKLFNSFIKQKFYLNNIKFISSPLGMKFPLIQEEHIAFNFSRPNFREFPEELFNEIDLNKPELSSKEIFYINGILKAKTYQFPKVVAFTSPFEKQLLYSSEYLNIRNPIGRLFVKICLSLIKIQRDKNYNKAKVDGLFDEIEKLPFMRWSYDSKKVKLSKLNDKFNHIFSEAIELGIILMNENIKVVLTTEDFVINSITAHTDTFSFDKINYFSKDNPAKKWGEPIS